MGGRRRRVLVAAVASAGLLTIGAGQAAPDESSRAQQEGGIFRVSLHALAGIDYMDPALASSPPGWALLDTTCARLMSY
ncbi:MAG: hypothetical protein M3364_02965, partial [Actinomycetota bacterium]|nr:hypothetical protein [Actinomycetota bacterium]